MVDEGGKGGHKKEFTKRYKCTCQDRAAKRSIHSSLLSFSATYDLFRFSISCLYKTLLKVRESSPKWV
jgi:hypothetical protein